MKKHESKDKPLTTQEACNYLGIKKATLYKLTSKRIIPHYKPNGSMIYFDVKDLEKYAYSNRIETID